MNLSRNAVTKVVSAEYELTLTPGEIKILRDMFYKVAFLQASYNNKEDLAEHAINASRWMEILDEYLSSWMEGI